jgi:hypothetical protein
MRKKKELMSGKGGRRGGEVGLIFHRSFWLKFYPVIIMQDLVDPLKREIRHRDRDTYL